MALALRRSRSRLLADLFWFLAITQSMTIIYWMINPILHPRYMLFLTSPLLILISLLMIRGWEQGALWRIYSIVLVFVLGGASLFSIHDLYTGTLLGFSHNSTKAMIDYLAEHASAQDGIISIDPNDYTLNYYDPGPASLFRAGLDDDVHTQADLVGFLQGKHQIEVVRFHAERSDAREIILFYLERFGQLVKCYEVPGYEIDIYLLDSAAAAKEVEMQPLNLHWDGIELDGELIQSGDAITVALHWQTDTNFHTDRQLAAIVQFIDPATNWLLAQSSSLLLSPNGAPTSQWARGQETTQYLVLPLLPGTPPIEGQLLVTLIDSETGQALDILDASGAPEGQQATLGQVIPGSAPDRWEYEVSKKPFTITSISSDLIQGYTVDWPTSSPGGTVNLTLQWLASPATVQGGVFRFELLQGNGLIASDNSLPLQGRKPAQVTNGSVWLDRRVLNISRDAHPGIADIVLVAGSETVELGQVEIIDFERILQRPPIDSPLDVTFDNMIHLIGYHVDIPDPLSSATPVPITLYWEALADGKPTDNFVITVQILDQNGRLIGQHDGIPVNGTRPFNGWMRGEYLIDKHLATFREVYQGRATIQISIYNPTTFEKLLTTTDADAVVLPITLTVKSAP